MLKLAYKLAKKQLINVQYNIASESEIRYDLFLGDIVLSSDTDNVDFSTQRGWVPLLDFYLSLEHILEFLPKSKEEVFEFTESEATLTFSLEGKNIRIISSYAEGSIVAPVSEFALEVSGQMKNLIHQLTQLHSDLSRNDYLIKRGLIEETQ